MERKYENPCRPPEAQLQPASSVVKTPFPCPEGNLPTLMLPPLMLPAVGRIMRRIKNFHGMGGRPTGNNLRPAGLQLESRSTSPDVDASPPATCGRGAGTKARSGAGRGLVDMRARLLQALAGSPSHPALEACKSDKKLILRQIHRV